MIESKDDRVLDILLEVDINDIDTQNTCDSSIQVTFEIIFAESSKLKYCYQVYFKY